MPTSSASSRRTARSHLGGTFTGCRLAMHFDNGEDVDNEEEGAPITVCDRLVGPWRATWNELQRFT